MNATSELENFRNEVVDEKRDDNRDKIIIGYLIYGLFNALLLLFLNEFIPEWYSGLAAKIIYGIFSLGWFVIPLLLAYQLKNERFRKIGIPLGIIYLIVKIASQIYPIVEAIYL